MNSSRRTFIGRALAGSAATVLPWQAATAQQPWPTKPIRWVNAWPPGSASDTYSRIYAEKLSKILGVPVIIENKSGAAGNIASEIVAKSTPDGYTFLYSTSSVFTINPSLYRNLPFDAEKDLTPVAPVLAQGGFIVVNNDLPVKSIQELVAHAKQNSGKLAYASFGTGSIMHLVVELIKDAAKLHIVHIPYRGSGMMDVISGRVHMMMEPANSAIPMIRTGKVRAIAFTGPKRHAQFPDLPTVSETFPGVIGWGWHGLWAPAGVPNDIIRRLNAEITRVTQSPDVAKQVEDLGSESLSATPEGMTEMVRSEAKVWRNLIRAKNITID